MAPPLLKVLPRGQAQFPQVAELLELSGSRPAELKRPKSTCWIYGGLPQPFPVIFLRRPLEEQATDCGEAFQLMETLHRAGERSNSAPQTPYPLWWGSDPAFIAYQYVEGTVLKDALRACVSGRFDGGGSTLDSLSRSAGAALGMFHQIVPVPDSEARADYGTFVKSRTVRLASRGVDLDRRCSSLVRSMVDPGPHNFVVTESGQPVMIDLPERRSFRPAEYDVAMLAHRTLRVVRNFANRHGLNGNSLGAEAYSGAVAGYGEFASLDLELLAVFTRVSAIQQAVAGFRRSRRLRQLRGPLADARLVFRTVRE